MKIKYKKYSNHLKSIIFYSFFCFFLASCSTVPPQNIDNICHIFHEKDDWYEDAANAAKKWGVPIQVMMSIMYQESGFRHDAQPPMEYFLFIPIGRASSAYGYAQAKTDTWDDYIRETGNGWADRDDFADATDFMGWFVNKTYKINKVSKWDAKAQYLNYHEGWGGYQRKTYLGKAWLVRTAQKVQDRAYLFGQQLKRCEADLKDDGWF